MPTVNKIVVLAKSQVGITELPVNSNTVKYNTWYYGREVANTETTTYPWCMTFQQWLANQTSLEIYRTASCTSLASWAKLHGQWVTSNYKVGDMAMFDFDGKRAKTEHIGLIVALGNGVIITVEGNTGNTNETNGGAVMQRTRKLNLVTGAWRPNYESEVEDLTKEETTALFNKLWAEKNPTYAHISDAPVAWQKEATELAKLDCINGGTSATEDATDLNVDKITLKAAIISKRYTDVKAK